jgi:DUF4097 and DUF4098 domain-containing protein YvlB
MRALIILFIGVAWVQTVSAADGGAYAEHVSASPTGTVEIDNVAGSVTVTGWEKPEVDVQGKLGASVDRVDVAQTADRIVIKVMLSEKRVPDHGAEATLQVRVPLNSTLLVHTVSAPITVDGLHGKSSLHSVGGDIRAALAGADEEVTSVGGNIYVSGNPIVTTLRTSTVGGTIVLTGGVGDIHAHTVAGRLDLAVDGAKNVDAGSVAGEVAVRGHLMPDAHTKASTVNGNMSIKVSADAGYTYEIASFGGSIHTCFGEQSVSGHLRGQVGSNGADGASVHLSTMHGTIDLCDK